MKLTTIALTLAITLNAQAGGMTTSEALEFAEQAAKEQKVVSTINFANIPKLQEQKPIALVDESLLALKQKADVFTLVRPKLKLFLSFSVPEASIKKYIKEADKLGRDNISIVILGMKKGTKSLVDTMRYVSELTKGKSVSFEIDPPSFERFGITKVPALVAYQDDPAYEMKCATAKTEKDMPEEHFEGVYGDVSIQYSLTRMAYDRNSQFKTALQKQLKRLAPEI